MEIDNAPPTPTCGWIQKVSFGLGHVFNDLCAAMWFSYTLFYLHVVLSIPSSTAGTLLMIGQVVDSIATPIAGLTIDKTGNKRAWHFGGTLFVAIGFSLLFSGKSIKPSSSILLAYYLLSIALFQTGWAIVQISHLSIIPDISINHSHSSDLTAIRYTASVCCSITVYLITLVVLQTNDNSSIGPNDFFKFKEIALIIVFIGFLTSLLFYCGLLGAYDTEYQVIREADDANNLNSNDHTKHFLKQSIIYFVALSYVASRLFTILNLIYIPLYLDERSPGEMDKARIRQTIATIPLVSYIASFLTALFLKWKNRRSDKLIYLLGGSVGIGASIWLGSGVSPISSDSELYAIAIFLGVSGSSTMISSLCLTANFVKTNGYGGGLVYSIVTFTDKLISGVVVLLVQNLQCSPKTLCPHYYENVLSYICGIVSLIGVLSIIILEIEIRRINGRSTT